MGRFPQPQGKKGSLRWIQMLVNDHPDVLAQGVGLSSVDWRSPLKVDCYAEYRDDTFLSRLGVSQANMKQQLGTFWPSRGPQWDALGRSAAGELVLVEAKAHLREMLSPPSRAKGQSAQAQIGKSLADVASAMGALPGSDWSRRFYQYCNRLAHAWFLHDVNGLNVRLAFVHFIGDKTVNGPLCRREWEAALLVLHGALGLTGRMPRYVVEVFIDVRPAVPIVL